VVEERIHSGKVDLNLPKSFLAKIDLEPEEILKQIKQKNGIAISCFTITNIQEGIMSMVRRAVLASLKFSVLIEKEDELKN
jgi:hypothetical protein